MKITVVICTHNRSKLLKKTLSSINRTLIPEKTLITILVIANNCCDDTICSLQNYQSRQKIENLISLAYAVEPKKGKSYALNKALALCNEGWICFIDDDHRLDNQYFKAVADNINDYPETNLFCGKIIPDWTGNEPSWAHETGEYKITPYPVPYFDLGDHTLMLSENTAIPGGGNLIIAREVFDKIGHFSSDLGPKGHDLMGSEDSDFVLRALRAGEPLRYIPTIVQYHYVNPKHFELTYVMKKSFQRNRSITLAQCPERTWPPIYIGSKLAQYFIKALLCFDGNRLRFYLTRISGTLGQLTGFLQSRKT